MADHDFDVAVTFAGEDREFVQEVVNLVKSAGYTVFYDQDFEHDFWGHDLTEYFPDVYERRARFAVMFISQAYAAKPWTRLERRSVLARAMNEGSPYLLPVRLDSTKLDGVRDSIGYLDGWRETPVGIARALEAKLGTSTANDTRLFNGRVPRTAAEASIVTGERPAGWEYLLFSYCLVEKVSALESRYDDHRFGFALPTSSIPDAELLGYVQARNARLRASVAMFEALLRGPAQREALGDPGEPGDPERIDGLSKRLVAVYADLLQWALETRSIASHSDEGGALLAALAAYAAQPIEAMRTFVFEFRGIIDEMNARLLTGENVVLELPIKFEIDSATSQRFAKALKGFERHLRSK
ncbi:toll/interleukin-1 receptor domain-containing protein [Leifsonia aquatica]|uniref:TIR domain-containing protein n=2 Tax=Leifsonia aquatica TaxID=144185 RepID=U2R8R6_LEIAQ|nr:TIR domain-containing protein [Leifsonia aquatica]ERK71650.1 hypothetical protein N136_01995 [Leifsonia aquatica ATCC 14665]MBB2967653.1 hypothetical protein [Leifsonia aquatica]